MIGSLGKIKGAKDANTDIEKEREELLKKQESFRTFYDKFHGIITAYETERRWLDGTTYITIPFSQIDDAAKRKEGNAHFSGSWDKFTPQITANVNGNPTSNSSDNEDIALNGALSDNGLLALINFLQNGQSSGVSSHSLNVAYSPGDPTIELVSGTQTVGKYLYIYGSGTSALVFVTGATGTMIDITEIIPPTGTIAIGENVIEGIPGFTNNERNTLVSSLYQNILTNLTNRITTRVALWNTALSNQLTQLSTNADSSPDIATAKTNIQTAQTAISTWNALPNTGTLGTDSKFTNNNLSDLATAYSARNSQRSTRVSQITSVIGTASQDASTGNISGTGIYTQRFKSISLMINSVDGPLFQYYSKLKLKNVNDQSNQNELGKLEIFSTTAKIFPLKSNAVGTNVVVLQNSAGLSVGNHVLVVANGLPDIEADVTNVAGNNVTLSKIVPATYTLVQKASLAKAL